MEAYLAPKTAAEHLAVSVKLIYKLVEQGELEVLRIGRSVRILASSLQDFIIRHTEAAALKKEKEPGLPPTPSFPSPTPPRRKREETGFVFLPRP